MVAMLFVGGVVTMACNTWPTCQLTLTCTALVVESGTELGIELLISIVFAVKPHLGYADNRV